MAIPTVAPLTEQDLREHRMLARIEALEAEVAELEQLLWSAACDYGSPWPEERARLH